MKMNIQKNRFAAILSLMLIVCMMTVMLVVPASAATVKIAGYRIFIPMKDLFGTVLEYLGADLHGCESYSDLAMVVKPNLKGTFQGLANSDGTFIYIPETSIEAAASAYNELYNENLAVPDRPNSYYLLPTNASSLRIPYTGEIQALSSTASDFVTYCTTSAFVNAIPDNSITTVLSQIVDLLPIVIPVFIGFIGLDKAIKFLIGVLRGA